MTYFDQLLSGKHKGMSNAAGDTVVIPMPTLPSRTTLDAAEKEYNRASTEQIGAINYWNTFPANSPDTREAKDWLDRAASGKASALRILDEEKKRYAADMADYNTQLTAYLEFQKTKNEQEIQKLQAQALTDPVAAAQVAKLKEQQAANDLAIAKAKTDSSNKKIYVIAAVVAGIAVLVATIWIVLTKQHVIKAI